MTFEEYLKDKLGVDLSDVFTLEEAEAELANVTDESVESLLRQYENDAAAAGEMLDTPDWCDSLI